MKICVSPGPCLIAGVFLATFLCTLGFAQDPVVFSDISALESMRQLRVLHLSRNNVQNLSPLSGLTRLEHVDLHANRISDVGPLSHLPSLDTLVLIFPRNCGHRLRSV